LGPAADDTLLAAILAAVVEERVDARAGALLLRPLLAIGIFSLLLWRWTDDLRLYAWAQFFPFLALVLQLYPPKYTGASYWIVAAALYALAKLLEFYDHAVYSVGSILSGHTLKHLAANKNRSVSCFDRRTSCSKETAPARGPKRLRGSTWRSMRDWKQV
jgi:hypothetical protein